MFLLVTLDKSSKAESFQYRDRSSPHRVQWESQNRTSQGGGQGQAIREHAQRGVAVHLFVRRPSKVGARSAPLVYCGDVRFRDWEGKRPITVRWEVAERRAGAAVGIAAGACAKCVNADLPRPLFGSDKAASGATIWPEVGVVPASVSILRDVIPERLAMEVRAFGDRYGIRNIRVFGSFARSEARPESDLDLLVEYVPGRSGFAFVEFCERVEELLGRRIDVVTDKSLHRLVRDKILVQVVPLCCRQSATSGSI